MNDLLQKHCCSQPQDKGSDWWINSPEHDYCFWCYVEAQSDCEGIMPELVQAQLAELLNWSKAKTYSILKSALQELSEILKTYDLREILSHFEEEELPGTPDPKQYNY